MKNKSYIGSNTEIVVCWECKGWGKSYQINENKVCKTCQGSGKLKQVSSYYKVKIK